MDELIKKLSGAKEGDRFLDAQIWAAVCRVEDLSEYGLADGFRPECVPWEEGVVQLVCVDESNGKRYERERRPAPPFSTSLDAAISLVPEGTWCGFSQHSPRDIFNPGGTQAFVTDYIGNGLYVHAEAATPALALCIAALQARSRLKARGGDHE